MKLVIMAGGSGTRLWPVSRKLSPKQIKPFFGKETLLQKTYKRLKKSFNESDIFISSNINQKNLIIKQLPKFPAANLILEPVRRDTAAAIGLVSATFARNNSKEIIATVNSDHYIKNEREFNRVLKLAGIVVQEHPNYLTLIGINPTYPETGYGYIKLDKQIQNYHKDKLYTVECFKEKPDLKTAKRYLRNWSYLWNPAYFVFRADKMLSLFKKHLPKQHRILKIIKENPDRLNREFPKIKPISVDYGIMEKTRDLLCLPANFDWCDIGHWRTVKDILSEKNDDNIIKGKYIGLESNGNLVYSYTNKLIATIGIKNTIIIETDDAVLVCPKDKAQDVKKLVDKFKKSGLNKYL